MARQAARFSHGRGGNGQPGNDIPRGGLVTTHGSEPPGSRTVLAGATAAPSTFYHNYTGGVTSQF